MHTPGPLEAYHNHYFGYWAVAADDTVCDLWRLDESTHDCHQHYEENAEDNAKLIAAAYTSYDRHCGSKAIELAESDLLGQLLSVCRGLLDDWKLRDECLNGFEAEFRDFIEDAFAKLPE